MKKLAIVTVLLLIVASSAYAAGRSPVKSGNQVGRSMASRENPAQTRARMNTPEVQSLIQRLQTMVVTTRGVRSKTDSSDATYVGAEFCIACHTNYSSWRTGAHATMFAGVPNDAGDMNPADGIIFDGNANGIDDFKEGLDFNQITSPFDVFKPNAPILSFVAGEEYPYRVTIGTMTHKVLMKQGGYYHQRLITRLPVTDTADGLSNGLYMLPFKYGPDTHAYVTYHAETWWDENGAPRIGPDMTTADVAPIGRSWVEKCAGCHVTGYRVKKDESNEWTLTAPVNVLSFPGDPHYFDLDKDGFNEFVGVGCESCHGPGSAHILGSGDPAQIVNPADLTDEQQAWLCGSCHTRAESVPTGAHDFGYDETADHGYRIGDNVWDYYQDNGGFWPDGITTAKGENQYPTYEHSAHFNNPFEFVACTSCHDPHSGERYLPKETVTEGSLVIETAFENDTLCLSCHAGFGPFADLGKEQVADYQNQREAIGTVVSSHTHHTYNPEGAVGLSRCTKCHMSRMAKRDYAYDETNHTMEALAPTKTLDLGMPNSCAASCHNSWPLNLEKVGFVDNLSIWTEPTDIFTADWLTDYYGIGGEWWDTTLEPNN